MKKLSPKQKKWDIFRSRKILHQLSKRKKRRRYEGKCEQHLNSVQAISHDFAISLPKNFSIANNSDECLEFFSAIDVRLRMGVRNTIFAFDAASVTTVDADALMYLIATIADTKFNNLYRYTFRGGFPKNETARKAFCDSGFLEYVETNSNEKIEPLSNKIRIYQGSNNDTDIAKQACTLAQERCNLSKVQTQPLYSMLIELMGNTYHHAYLKDRLSQGNARLWYFFAEELDNELKFVFLDTGLGIPSTVRKKDKEKKKEEYKKAIETKIKNKYIKKAISALVNQTTDAEYIQSALNGDFRSRTGKQSRGNGLPQISECLKCGLLSESLVLSGHGGCRYNCDNINGFACALYKPRLKGTLFYWSIRKRELL